MKVRNLLSEIEKKQSENDEKQRIIETKESEMKLIQKELNQLKTKQKDEVEKLKNELKSLEHSNSIEYKEGHEFEGIIKFLTDKTGGNIHDNKTIEVTSNSIQAAKHPKLLLDQEKANYGPKLREKDFWVCFDFKSMEIKVFHYSIKSYNHLKDIGHIKSWIIETSSDARNWTKIDEHLNSSELSSFLNLNSIEFYGILKNFNK